MAIFRRGETNVCQVFRNPLYLPLAEGDNRGPEKELEEVLGSDGRYILSWIWCSNTTAVSADGVNEDMRVEWAQCVARMDWWGEQVILL